MVAVELVLVSVVELVLELVLPGEVVVPRFARLVIALLSTALLGELLLGVVLLLVPLLVPD